MPPIPADAQHGDSEAVRIHDRIKYGLVRRMARKQGGDSVSEEHCGNCRFFKSTADEIRNDGFCKRNPPIIDHAMLGHLVDELHEAAAASYMAWTHPTVMHDNWCGEWRQPGNTTIVPIDDLQLSIRSRRAIEGMGITTANQLAKLTAEELLKTKKFGQTSLSEVRFQLYLHNLTLLGDVSH